MTVTAPAASPEHLNQLMIDAIAAARPVGTSDPRVLAAIRAVPRHAFVPGADLADAYNPDLAVITKRGPAGAALSCASVPYLVAAMLEQLDVRKGHRVFGGRGRNRVERRAARHPRRARRARQHHRHRPGDHRPGSGQP
jgi:hypothetical protein